MSPSACKLFRKLLPLAACCSLVCWTGCAQMFNNEWDELNPRRTPPFVKDADDVNPDVGEMKLDPLLLQLAEMEARDSATKPADRKQDITDDSEMLSTVKVVHEASPGLTGMPLQPVVADIEEFDAANDFKPAAVEKKPIILRAQQISQDTPGQATNGPFRAVQADPYSKQVTDAEPILPEAEDTSTRCNNNVAHESTTFTAATVDNNRFDAGPAVSSKDATGSSSNTLCEQQLAPPVDSHPPSDYDPEKTCPNMAGQGGLPAAPAKADENDSNSFVPRAVENPGSLSEEALPIDGDEKDPVLLPESASPFVEQLIAGVLAGEPEDEPIAAASFNSVASPGAETPVPKLTWQNQLDKTIEVFESQIAEAPEESEQLNLDSGLAILQSLRQLRESRRPEYLGQC